MANYVYLMTRMLHFYKFTVSCRHDIPTHKPQAVSDWLNAHSLGTISAFGSIENVA